ncbi:hypothetical protein [Burkholderia metallica]|uniref:Uncharacterized protein n=1 Tax=Burkholderia metallica TaxID=488729 RepID=A0ABT8PBC9_9BURK|nr:hypothetical protein [Burkholderia metallica]MCA7996950.1 hypothetical protein [Burkholderia metallica]MDN7932348.1 hypothetical protein [Burkholderia metallica]
MTVRIDYGWAGGSGPIAGASSAGGAGRRLRRMRRRALPNRIEYTAAMRRDRGGDASSAGTIIAGTHETEQVGRTLSAILRQSKKRRAVRTECAGFARDSGWIGRGTAGA